MLLPCVNIYKTIGCIGHSVQMKNVFVMQDMWLDFEQNSFICKKLP